MIQIDEFKLKIKLFCYAD